MENSSFFLNKKNILEASLEEVKRDYDNLLDFINKFINENSKKREHNKSEYDFLYENLGNFYKLIINMSYMDLRLFPIQKKFLYAEKKNFALNIKNSLRNLLVRLEELATEEESPFYERL